MNTDSPIFQTVMRRVRTIHTLRTVLPAAGMASFLLALALLGIGKQVWVAKVYANMPSVSDVPAITWFFASAVTHTDLIVQLLLVVAVGALVWLAREIARLLSTVGRYA